jgi:hypothetical protein
MNLQRLFLISLGSLAGTLMLVNVFFDLTTSSAANQYFLSWRSPYFVLLLLVTVLLFACVKQLFTISNLSKKIKRGT